MAERDTAPMHAPRPPDRPAHAVDAASVQAAPVWRYLHPDESDDPQADETWVRAQTSLPGPDEWASCLASATFTLSDGTSLPGLVQVDRLGSKVEFRPECLFVAGKTVDALGREAPQRLARLLRSPPVRPQRWRLDVLLPGETRPREGTIASSTWLQALALLVQLGRLRRRR